MRTRAIVLLLACAGAVQGADARSRPPPAATTRAAPDKAFPFNVDWVLQRVNDKPVGAVDPPSLSIDQSLRGRGFAGCNTFSMALYPVKNQTLASGAIAMTRRSCDPAVMSAEHTFLLVLHSLPHWEVTADGDLLVTAQRVALRFHRGI